jgi:hypothetical protein
MNIAIQAVGAMIIALLGGVSNGAADPPLPQLAESKVSVHGGMEGRQFRGRYANIDYGFTVDIPGTLVGEGTAAPAPNHGFEIRFDERSVVWVDATYDVTEPPHRFGRINASLGGLNAERKKWTTVEDGREELHQEIIARGFDRGSPIIYTIRADTALNHRDEAFRVFEAVLKSFHTIPIRP